MSAVTRLTAGVLGALVAVGATLACVGGREFLAEGSLLALGAAGLYAAARGREPRWFRG